MALEAKEKAIIKQTIIINDCNFLMIAIFVRYKKTYTIIIYRSDLLHSCNTELWIRFNPVNTILQLAPGVFA